MNFVPIPNERINGLAKYPNSEKSKGVRLMGKAIRLRQIILIGILICLWPPLTLGSPTTDSPKLEEFKLFPQDHLGQTITFHFTKINHISRARIQPKDMVYYTARLESKDGTTLYTFDNPHLLIPESMAKELLTLTKNEALRFNITLYVAKNYLQGGWLAHADTIRVIDRRGVEQELLSGPQPRSALRNVLEEINTQELSVPPKTPEQDGASLATPQPTIKKSNEIDDTANAGHERPSRDSVGFQKTFPPTYPKEAREKGQEGTVLIRLTVTQEGFPWNVAIRKSSGHLLLDEAGRTAVEQWTFTPAKRNGQPIQSVVEIPINFDLKKVD